METLARTHNNKPEIDWTDLSFSFEHFTLLQLSDSYISTFRLFFPSKNFNTIVHHFMRTNSRFDFYLRVTLEKIQISGKQTIFFK